jgi:ABC-type transporter Mla subunit MlaD
MPNPIDAVNEVFNESVAELQRTLGSTEATAAQRRTAKETLRDIWLLHGTHAIQEVHGRTALLTGLISELEELIARIEQKPFGDALDKLTGIVTTAKKLYDEEKKHLRAGTQDA